METKYFSEAKKFYIGSRMFCIIKKIVKFFDKSKVSSYWSSYDDLVRDVHTSMNILLKMILENVV